MTEMTRLNVGGNKYQLGTIYTTLINLPNEIYDQQTQHVGDLVHIFGITYEEAFILKAPHSPMMNTMMDLRYDKFAAHTQASSVVLTIPNTIPIDLHHAMTQAWTYMIALKPTTMDVWTPRVMTANPGCLVPICISIIDIYNRYNAEEHDEPLKTYSLSILPTPFTHRKFIALLPENIKTRSGYQGVINRGDGPTFLASYQIFNDVFQFRKFGIKRTMMKSG
ncbi:hypothetical protein BC941DRAFT_518019 [Chlamydoabsidia padenii]|nr:hypothetical protein BC941DRAFT_518019 [Chlamydoabsidia padenii]